MDNLTQAFVNAFELLPSDSDTPLACHVEGDSIGVPLPGEKGPMTHPP